MFLQPRDVLSGDVEVDVTAGGQGDGDLPLVAKGMTTQSPIPFSKHSPARTDT